METGDISNEEGDALLSDEKIVTRKQSKADSVARKSNVNSDENVNQPAELLKNQDTRGRQIACKTIKFTAEISEEKLTFLDTKVYKGARFHKESTCKHTRKLMRIFNTHISVGSKHLSGKKRHNTIHQRTAGVA